MRFVHDGLSAYRHAEVVMSGALRRRSRSRSVLITPERATQPPTGCRPPIARICRCPVRSVDVIVATDESTGSDARTCFSTHVAQREACAPVRSWTSRTDVSVAGVLAAEHVWDLGLDVDLLAASTGAG